MPNQSSIFKHTLLTGCTVAATFGGDAMAEKATIKTYSIPPVIGTPLVAVVVDDEIRLVDKGESAVDLAQLEEDALSVDELLEVREYLRATGQASA